MVGQRILDPFILVRVQAPQQIRITLEGYFNNTSSMHHHIEFVKILNHTSIAEWIAAISTLLAAIATFGAIIVAIFGEKLKRWFIKPRLVLIDVRKTQQTVNDKDGKSMEVEMFRFHLKNEGSASTGSVKAIVVHNSNVDQERFIPIPLNWTHVGNKRDIAGGEELYLDLFLKNENSEYSWCWPHGIGPNEPAITKLKTDGKSNIKVDFYDKYSLLNSVTIKFDPKNDSFEIPHS
jgi:hypothetical protein